MSDITPITMPKFGLAMTEGKIVSWAKQEGSEVAVGEELADIETTKITNAYASPVKGVLRRRVVAEQDELPVGALIAVVADASVPDSEIDAFIKRGFFKTGPGTEDAPAADACAHGDHHAAPPMIGTAALVGAQAPPELSISDNGYTIMIRGDIVPERADRA